MTATTAPDGVTTDLRRALLSDLETVLTEGVEKGACGPSWAAAALDIIAEALPLAADDQVYAAHLLHRSVRAEASKDGPPVARIATLRAPDLQVGRHGATRVALPTDTPADLVPFADVVARRHSTPMYGSDPLPLEHLAGILRHSLGAKGVSQGYQRNDIPKRVIASAGGLQAFDCQVIVNDVESIEPGRYSYDPTTHELVLEESGDFRLALVDLTIESEFVLYAQAVVALTGNFPRVAWKYGTRGYRYMGLDAGGVAAHLYLAAAALGVSVNALAAFADDKANATFRLDGKDEFVQLLIALGTPPGARRR